jgi:DNA-directed RNA polymerase specialized sigma24 family protein
MTTQSPEAITKLLLAWQAGDQVAFDARKAKVVELRFFGGLTLDETAKVLGVSTDTVGRDWDLAKAWLYREMGHGRRA